jgi:hypothetical protein
MRSRAPQLTDEPVGGGALQQGLSDLAELASYAAQAQGQHRDKESGQ